MEKIRGLVRTPWRAAAAALLGTLLVATIYRAATQAISHDEAVMFEWFQSGPWSQLFGAEFGNHHPLTVLFSRISIGIFGLSEFSQRLPSVLGAALYFYTVFRICGFLGEGAMFLLGVAFLSLNPFLLDYLCLSRGYSLGLALFMYALYQLMLYLSATRGARNPNRVLNKAGIAAGLSIGCNVIMIFPVGALALGFFALLIADSIWTRPTPGESAAAAADRRKKKKERKRKARADAAMDGARSAWQAMIHMAAPAVLVAGFSVMLPRKLVYLEEGYLGPPSLFAILEGIVRPSLVHSATGQLGLAALVPPDFLVRAVTFVVAPAVLLAVVAWTVAAVREWARGRTFDSLPEADRLLLLLGGAMPAALAMIVASRYWFAQPYPEMRTVLYWIPLFSLAALALVKKLLSGPRAQQLGAAPATVLMVLCVVQFATQFNTRYFAEWSYCAATKDMMAIIRAQHAAKPDARVRVGASWEFEPGINFYRAMWQLTWMDPVFRESPDADYDYYLLLRGDQSLVERRRLKLLLKDELSQSSLAKAGG